MASPIVKVGKVFGIHPDPYGTHDYHNADSSIAAQANVEPYDEADPTVGEWFRSITPSAHSVGLYFYNLFPFLRWITRYNLTWLAGDLIAGKCIAQSPIAKRIYFVAFEQTLTS